MSIFSLFRQTEDQEATATAYQSWREENPDNPSDDDFYQDEDEDDHDDSQEDDDTNNRWWLW
jgi:hypothetical protein